IRWRTEQADGTGGLIAAVALPDSLDGFFLTVAQRAIRAFGIGPVTASPFSRQPGDHAAARHLQVAVRIVFPYPVPGVLQPLVPVVFRLQGEPADFVIAPHEPFLTRNAGLWADPIIVHLYQIRKVRAFPARGGDASFAPVVNHIHVV